MGTLKQLSRIQSDDDSLNRLQDQLASALNPILRNIKGDLSGPLESPTVSKIQGYSVSAVQPQNGDALVFDGRQYVPQPTGGVTITLAGDVTGPSNANTVEAIQSQPVSAAAPSTGDVLTWDGSQWEGAAPSGSTLAGDVTGPASANTVERIQGYDVSTAAPSTDDVLAWSGTEWTPTPATAISIYPQMPPAWTTEYLWWKLNDAPQPLGAPNQAANSGSAGVATLTATANPPVNNSNGGAFYDKTPMFGVSGQYSTIARFRGSTNTLQGADAIYTGTTAVTLSAWVNISESGGGFICDIVKKKHPLGMSVGIQSVGGRAYYTVLTGAGSVAAFSAQYILGYGFTVNLAMTYDGTNIRGYINGQEVVSVAQTGNIVWLTGAGNEWEIGQPTGGIDRYDIWDVRFSDSVRSAAQLLSDYKTGSGFSY